jgi:hypothetical protein
MKNIGQVGVDYSVENGDSRTGGPANPLPEMSLTPTSGQIGPGESVTVSVHIPTSELPYETYASAATIRTKAGQVLVVPMSLHVLSPFEYLKSKLGLRAP